MIQDDRLIAYFQTLYQELPDDLKELESWAKSQEVPIIRRETQNLLRLLLQMQQPQKILEVGTAVGFSALFMERMNPVKCDITTIENYEVRIPIARENFIKANKEEKIHLLEGDATEILPGLEGTYDFVFMDAAKGQYIHFLPELKRLTHPGSLIVTDNVLQDGDILESHFVVTRRNRTIHKRMRQYLKALMKDTDFVCDILPVGDGVAVCSVVK